MRYEIVPMDRSHLESIAALEHSHAGGGVI